MHILNFFKNKFFLGLIIFLIVFSIFAFCIGSKDIWFSLDDLGNIIAGLINNFKDFVRVFTEDERIYIYPDNFTIPTPNSFIKSLVNSGGECA